MVFTREQFIRYVGPNKIFMKCLNDKLKDKLNDNDFQYNLGLNVIRMPSNLNGSRPEEYLHFTTNEYIHEFICYGPNIAIIELCKNSKIYCDPDNPNKFNTDKFIIKKIIPQTEQICMEAVKQNGLALCYVKNQIEKICVEAVKRNGFALLYVKEQTDEICLEAVKQCGQILEYVKNQTNKICIEAVKKNGMALGFVKKQTEEICIEAVKQNGLALQYVKKQTEQICTEAVKQCGDAQKYVKRQTEI